MRKLFMMVGIPGSGKSSFITSDFLGEDTTHNYVMSSDELREFYKKKGEEKDNKYIFQELHQNIDKIFAIDSDATVIYDATNINAKRRKNYLKKLGKDIEKNCILKLTDIDIAYARNMQRNFPVPKYVIESMYTHLQIPQFDEGWDNIFIVPEFDNTKDYNINSLMDELIELDHENPNHLLTIGNHICAVTKYVSDTYGKTFAGDIDRLYILNEAAFYHDIGKKYTKSFKDKDGSITDIAHYYGHENVSAYLYLLYKIYNEEKNIKFVGFTKNMGINRNNILYVADLIQNHMMFYDKILMGKGSKYLINKLGQRQYEDLNILHEADIKCQ